MFSIFAKIKPKSDFFEDAKKAILNIIPKTRKEKGCITFNLHELVEPNGMKYLCLYEIFKNQNDYHFHHAQDYTRKVFEHYKQWLDTPAEINQLEPIDIL